MSNIWSTQTGIMFSDFDRFKVSNNFAALWAFKPPLQNRSEDRLYQCLVMDFSVSNCYPSKCPSNPLAFKQHKNFFIWSHVQIFLLVFFDKLIWDFTPKPNTLSCFAWVVIKEIHYDWGQVSSSTLCSTYLIPIAFFNVLIAPRTKLTHGSLAH